MQVSVVIGKHALAETSCSLEPESVSLPLLQPTAKSVAASPMAEKIASFVVFMDEVKCNGWANVGSTLTQTIPTICSSAM
jgi:hypothetical protein